MPLYEYQCDACGHRFEVIQKFSDSPVEVCPKCGSTVHKLASAPAFHLKGSGWYITDYAKKDSGGGKADSAKNEKSEKSEKAEKADKGEKSDSGTSSSSSSGESKTTSPAPTPSTTKSES